MVLRGGMMNTDPYIGSSLLIVYGPGPLAAQYFMKPQQPKSALFWKDYQNARRT